MYDKNKLKMDYSSAVLSKNNNTNKQVTKVPCRLNLKKKSRDYGLTLSL